MTVDHPDQLRTRQRVLTAQGQAPSEIIQVGLYEYTVVYQDPTGEIAEVWTTRLEPNAVCPSSSMSQHQRQQAEWSLQTFTQYTTDSRTFKGFVSGAYYTSWSRYARKHMIKDLSPNQFTLLIYAFLKPTDTGAIILTDPWSDTDFRTDWSTNPNPPHVYGNFGDLWALKQQHRHLKTLISVGGWTFSSLFSAIAADVGKRAMFVQSCVEYVRDMGVDGVDIDWEYPGGGRDDIPHSDQDGRNFVTLLQELGRALDQLAGELNHGTSKFWITAAVPAPPNKIQHLDVQGMNRVLDYFLLMTYDFEGPGWSSISGHQANLYSTRVNQLSVDVAVHEYLKHGVNSRKLLLGMPLYGRVFSGSRGVNETFDAGRTTQQAGQWEAGIFDAKVLPRPGAQELYDNEAGAAYTYDSTKQEFITYDSTQSVSVKANYIKSMNLGGWFFWETSGDDDNEKGIIKAVVKAVGGLASLDKGENGLEYPNSKYGNVSGKS